MVDVNLAEEATLFEAPLSPAPVQETSIQDAVRDYMDQYFANLGGEKPQDIYQRVLELVELPLLEEVMRQVGNNQCKATRYLGLARGTVIKKLKQYGLIRPKQRRSVDG